MPPKAAAPKATAPRARSKSVPRASISGAGKAAAPKAVPKASAKAATPSPPPSSAPAPEPAPSAAEAAYHGSPLELPKAEALLRSVTAEQLRALAATSAPEEQLPARMMLEFVGDDNLSWENAQKSLKEGCKFLSEVFEMKGAEFVTKKSLERLEGLGHLSPGQLRDRSPAAFALAVYLEAVVDLAKEKLGLKVEPVVLQPEPDEEPPAWPIVIDVKDIPAALADAVKWQRTPLFVCNGKASVVDTFFSYRCCSLIDAKWVMNKVDIVKELDVPQAREELRTRLVAGMKAGWPIHIAMSTSAVSLRGKYCSEADFPEALFKNEEWLKSDVYSKVIRDADLADWPGAFPGRMKADSPSFSFVTTDMGRESACEFLPEALPHFDSMAIIEIDPASIL